MEPQRKDSLKRLKRQFQLEIKKQYPTVEKFCFENNLPKSTVSRLLEDGYYSLTLETLFRVAIALNKSLEIKLK